MAKASSKKTGLTKKDLHAAIAEAVRAGKELHLESVDFSDPNRPKTCLEVDFPIIPVNSAARVEGSSGATRKAVYQATKWWARRNSSVFRSMLIAAATRSPEDPVDAARTTWDAYYGNHQNNEAFQNLKVADIFMGGGTTIVEGARLGMQMYGNDLNPVAWFVVKSELALVDPAEVQALLNQIEAEVKPQIMPFYACNCPRGHKGKWTQRSTGKLMGKSFDPQSLTREERTDYEYKGPEVIYSFLIKHGPCQATGCGHRTPIMSSPIIAVKTLTVKAWKDIKCGSCKNSFDVEEHDARIAPTASFVVSPEETPFAVRQGDGSYQCPYCGHHASFSLGKPQNKSAELTLLCHPNWIKGTAAADHQGEPYGGSRGDSIESTTRWHEQRSTMLRFIEVRGPLPVEVTCPDGSLLRTDKRGGTVPKPSHFECGDCGALNDVLTAMTRFGKDGPTSLLATHGYCPECDKAGFPYSGRFFSPEGTTAILSAEQEWLERNTSDLAVFWPKTPLPLGFKTTYQRIPEHGYPRFADMFNSRQLLVHSQLLKALLNAGEHAWQVRESVLGAFQQYLRNQNMFCFWNQQADQLEPLFSNNNYHPKPVMIENNVFGPMGRGNWLSCSLGVIESIVWCRNPSEILSADEVRRLESVDGTISGKSIKIATHDPVCPTTSLTCGSASDLVEIASSSIDLVVTDPPFGNNIQYSELADFFYVWLRLALRSRFPYFEPEHSPKALEVVDNPVRHGEETASFYQKMLTACWREAHRIMKAGGILAFTFHHSEDEPWVAVLESLFQAGFYLETAYPIRSDETKGEGAKPGTFGSQLIEYDIIHVCRKRSEKPQEISWARLRRHILQDVRQLQDMLEHHQQAGLAEADLQVIRRGKALEHYSKHYGTVYVERGREFTVKEALAGINQLLDDQRDSSAEVPPVDAEPYTRQFLRLFADCTSLPRDQIQKFLRGTGVSPNEFQERGWCIEKSKVFHFTPPLEQAQRWKGVSRQGMGRDFDQSMFLIGACYENSGIRVNDTLSSERFIPHPATRDILDWFTRHGGDAPMKEAAQLAKQLYTKWEASNQPKVQAAQGTFGFAEDEV